LINERPVKHCIVFYTGLWTWLTSRTFFIIYENTTTNL